MKEKISYPRYDLMSIELIFDTNPFCEDWTLSQKNGARTESKLHLKHF